MKFTLLFVRAQGSGSAAAHAATRVRGAIAVAALTTRGVRIACLEVSDVLQGGLCDSGEGFSREESLVAGDNHVRKRQETCGM